MIFGGCASKLVLFPSTDRRMVVGAKTMQLPCDHGAVVEVWTHDAEHTSAPANAFVLEFGGNAERAEDLVAMSAQRWSFAAAEVWAVNYPGYGGSTGPASLRAIPPAALLAYDQLAIRAAGRPIYVSGVSIGTSVALYVAANRPVAGVVLQNPPPLRELILGRFGWWNLWLLAGPVAMGVPWELESLNTAPKVTAPAVFILADCDTVVPPPYHRRVVNAYGGPRQTITLEGADHNDSVTVAQENEIEEALGKMIKEGKNAKR